ncbi:hypothetical protein [Streptomyces sp. NBC_00467]|uniref:hypothetical protein n=1 Tax=Streptomyces sp. NBC_00467 TaxID=2975752 RepID=UPI002E18E06B
MTDPFALPTAEDTHLVEEERRQREYEALMAALRAAREKRRDEIRAKNAMQAARAARTGRRREVATRFRPGIDLALAKLADEHGVRGRGLQHRRSPVHRRCTPRRRKRCHCRRSIRTPGGSAATPSGSWPVSS